jgi:hypothetical protein
MPSRVGASQIAKSFYAKQRERAAQRKLLHSMGLSTQRVQTAGSSSKKSVATVTPSVSSSGNDLKKFYVSSGLGEGVLHLPSSYRVTFGPNVPGARNNMPMDHSTSGYAIRIYRDNTNNSLCGVIPNVYAFLEEGVQLTSLSQEVLSRTISMMLGDVEKQEEETGVPF